MGRLLKIIQSNIEPKLREMGGYDPAVGALDAGSDLSLEAGDVIGITRPAGYEHYAVYIGGGRVIHFAASDNYLGAAAIREAPMSDFLEGQREFFVLDFSGMGRHPTKKAKGSQSVLTPLPAVGMKVLREAIDNALAEPYDVDINRIYTPEETVARAKSVIGANELSFRRDYDLVFNNCEHFAVWCKTGVHKSYQVENILKLLPSDLRYYL